MKLSGTLPEGDVNGLAVLVRDMIREPLDRHYIVAIVDCVKTVTNNDTGDVEPTMRIVAAEAATGAVLESRARGLLEHCYEDRTGIKSLPFDVNVTVERGDDQ